MKTHLISGVSSGIGRAIAARLSARGDQIVPVLRNESQLGSFPSAPEAVICDFNDPAAVERAFANLKTPVSSFINCAGIMISKTLFESTFEQLAEMINVNLFSAMTAVARVAQSSKPAG